MQPTPHDASTSPRPPRARLAALAGAIALGALTALPPVAARAAPGSAFALRLPEPRFAAAGVAAASDPAPAPPAPAFALGVREDRWQHAGLSFALVAAGVAGGIEPAPAVAGAFVLGLAKELFDARTDRFDAADLAADAAGALLAAVALGALAR